MPPPSSHATLLQQLESLAQCPLAGECLHIHARQPHTVKSLRVERATLGVLLHGSQRLSSAQQTLDISAGELFLITAHSTVDVFNTPSAQGQYLAISLNLCDEVLQAARILWAQPLHLASPELIGLPIHTLASPLQTWSQALHEGRNEQARAALVQILLWLCQQGHHSLLAAPPQRLADQVRQIIAQAPHQRWVSRDIETQLNLSGASLRRRLAAEGTSLSHLLIDVRMGQALELLYTTALPIKTVAARSGYQSVHSFTRQFVQRYQLRPTDIGLR